MFNRKLFLPEVVDNHNNLNCTTLIATESWNIFCCRQIKNIDNFEKFFSLALIVRNVFAAYTLMLMSMKNDLHEIYNY